MEWTKRKSGWGTTEYTTSVNGTRYVARKTGGRFISWEVREDRLGGERMTSGSKLSTVKENFESKIGRLAA